MLNIDELIKNAIKSQNKEELNAYKNLKAQIQKYKTSKNAKQYDDSIELTIISQYCKSLEDAVKQFSEAGRYDLVASYTTELEVLKKFLPEPVSVEDIEFILYNWAEHFYTGEILEDRMGIFIPKKEMGNAIKHLKSKFPTADGKMISDIVKKYIQ